jgi:hypothetical protein
VTKIFVCIGLGLSLLYAGAYRLTPQQGLNNDPTHAAITVALLVVANGIAAFCVVRSRDL